MLQTIKDREQPVNQLLLIQHVQDAGLPLHSGVKVLVLLGVLQLDNERRRERILARHVLELGKLADGIVIGLLAVKETHRFDVGSRFDLLP